MPRVDLPPKGRPGAGYCSFYVSTWPTGTLSRDKCIRYGRVIIFGEKGIGLNTFSRI